MNNKMIWRARIGINVCAEQISGSRESSTRILRPFTYRTLKWKGGPRCSQRGRDPYAFGKAFSESGSGSVVQIAVALMLWPCALRAASWRDLLALALGHSLTI